MSVNPNQFFYDPSTGNIPPNALLQNQIFPPLPNQMKRSARQKSNLPFSVSRIPSLHLPAILLLSFCWLIHTISTFIPYWSIYSGISGSRAGLWSARNFNYTTIQNFYFPEPNSFGNLTRSIRFVTANTKGYLITVQFLMTFNFVMMTLLLILLAVDYIIARRSPNEPRSALIRQQNTSDTALIYGLLLYVLYVFTVFEFAAWITYAGARHDNNWHFHASFGLTIVISIFLIIVFAMYAIEFFRIFAKNRISWEYWYGPYVEWGFFVHLSALLLLLLVICCPEWAYRKYSALFIFAEIGPFKQCFLSVLYKKTPSTRLCTLSSSRSNQAWVNATQAFLLMAFIFGTILLILMIVFRKQFRHNQQGYHSNRFRQPTFTYVIAGLILFFCFIFTLIAISIFGGEVFPNSITANWGYIVAVFAMVLFLIAGILFILDGVHSRKQTSATKGSKAQKFLFPEPLNNRLSAMQPLLKQEPSVIPPHLLQTPLPLGPPVIPYDFSQAQPPIYPGPYFDNPSFFPPQQNFITPTNYALDPYRNAPLTQATLSHYFQQMINNPQSSSLPPPPYNLGLANYSGGYPSEYPGNRDEVITNDNITNMVQQHFVQQQRLNYNHERLLEKYGRLGAPRTSGFRSYGANSLPGRNYDQYLRRIRSNDGDPYGPSLAAQSRARIPSSDETYRWMDNEYYEPLPKYVSSGIHHSRNDPTPSVRAEKFEPVHMYDHSIFGPTPAYLRPVRKRRKTAKKKDQKRLGSNHFDHEKETKVPTTRNDNLDGEIGDRLPLGHTSHQNWKRKTDRLIPVDPLLFDIYNQRSNGHIQDHDQSLYASFGQDNRPNLSENITTTFLSDTEFVLTGKTRQPPASSSNSRYHKLHSKSTAARTAHQLPELSSSDVADDLSGHVIRRSDPPTALQSRDNFNSSTASTLSSTLTPILTATNNAAPLKPEYIPTSNSLVSHKRFSSTAEHPLTIVTRSNSKEALSNLTDNHSSSTNDHVLSNNSDNDSDKEENIKRRRAKKKSTTAIDDNIDDNSSSSDD